MKTLRTLARDLLDVYEALWGPRRARAKLKWNRTRGRALEAGLAAILRRWPDVRSNSREEPIFVLSAGWRSGSTMLQRLLMHSGKHIIWGEPYGHAGLIDALAAPIGCFTDDWPHDAWFAAAADSNQDLTSRWVANLYPPPACLLHAHIQAFERLFAEPARNLGARGWGVKEVRLTTSHALYLRWLFPRAKFLFLYRSPYAAYQSYRPYRRWYVTWPDRPVFTPWAFGRQWQAMTEDFLAGYHKVDGLLVRYEDLIGAQPPLEAISNYLGFKVLPPDEIPRIADSGLTSSASAGSALERVLLRATVHRTASRLGYRPA